MFDLSEDGLFKLQRKISDSRLRTLLGDIRDRERVKMALNKVDIIVHAAAVKNIEVSEYNAAETCRVNVEGTINLVETAMQEQVKRFLFISSDKAASYSTLYGATKFLGEKITVWASRISLNTVFSTVRFGNVFESRGNVFEVWYNEEKSGKPLSVTHPEMKRYFWHLGEASDFVIQMCEKMENGCIYIPKLKEYSILDLAKQHGGEIRIIGLRKGEKMREILFAEHEKVEEAEEFWVIKE